VIPCSNPACHEGGYEIDKLIASMIRLGETEREGVMLCSGREVGDEVRRGPVRCPHRIAYRATISVRGDEGGDDRERERERERTSRRPQHRRGRGRPPRRRDVA
jgi:hypothetical protein